ncbi:MAG TPA: HEAT repeat domain-containing protein, partial [Longimicrobium sp.]|nr:HEAT repeat domain-containing protein [Longimicrobium sp.]
IAALAELRDAGSREAITGALADADAEVRGLAAWALAELGVREAPRALLDMAASERDPEARQKALWALAETNDPRGVAIFREALKDANAEVRKTALYGLTELRDAASADAFARLLRSDPDPEVRRAAARALGEIQ